MTQNTHHMRGQQNAPERGQPHRTLSLSQRAPADWHHDRPAFAGDPYMDWESGPEPPKEPRWSLGEGSGRTMVRH
ncbi:MAG TPA: hypothetical protein VD902_00075 [Symbiobacteriaceae bacterium]|nr:hypothetical protein [Symbiobacteriaceae bacterium]